MIDHCVSALNEYAKRRAYEVYVTDCLYALVTSKITMACRYFDMIEKKKEQKPKTRKEIVSKLRKKLEG